METLDLPFKGSVEKGIESLVSSDEVLGSGGDGHPPSLVPAVMQSTTQQNTMRWTQRMEVEREALGCLHHRPPWIREGKMQMCVTRADQGDMDVVCQQERKSRIWFPFFVKK